MDKQSNFKENYNFLIGAREDGKFYAHRPIEPAFLVERHTEEDAVDAALDIIAGYIRRFQLQAQEGVITGDVLPLPVTNTKSYQVVGGR